jgi:hypothetical protein
MTAPPQKGTLRGRTRFTALFAASLLFAAASYAQESSSSFSVGVGAEYSDNIRRESTNEESDTIALATFNSDIRRTSQRFDLGFNSDLAYEHYLQDTYDAEVRGNALLDAEAQIVKQRLSWYLNDRFGQLRRAALAPDTPDNRENLNVLATGPRFTQPFGARTQLLILGVYEIESYEESPLDSTRTGGDISLRHELSAKQYLQLTAARRSTRYEDGAELDDYDLDEYFLAWSASGAKTSLTIDAGESRTSGSGRDDSSLLLRLDAERKIGSFGTLTLTGRSQQASTVDAFRVDQGDGALGLGTQPRSAVAEPFDFDFVGLGYEVGARRFSVSLFASTERDRYQVQTDNDHDRKAIRGKVRFVPSPTWTIGAGVEYARETYIQTDARFKEVGFTVDATVSLTRALSLLFGAVSIDRTGEVGSLAYDEMRARILLTYTGGR